MDVPSIRLECSRVARNLQARRGLEGRPFAEVAEELVKFCGEGPTRLQALIYAYSDTGRGTGLAKVTEIAKELADFAEKTPAPVHKPTRGGRSRGRSESR